MRALVTGGTGFVGNRLVLHLAQAGWDVICLVRRPASSRLEQVRTIVAELGGEPNALSISAFRRQLPENIDCVFHLAASISSPEWAPSGYLTANGVATSSMLELAEALKARSFVYTSTQLVIGKPERTPFDADHPTRPENAYALSKLAGELSCEFFRRSGRVAATSLRLTSVVGSGMAGGVLSLFLARALRSENLTYHGSGARVQNFIHVDDVVRACVMAAAHPGSGVLNAGGVDSLSMTELAGMILRAVPQSASLITASGRPDPQDDYRWIPELDSTRAAIGYAPAECLQSFLPDYLKSFEHPAVVETWREPEPRAS